MIVPVQPGHVSRDDTRRLSRSFVARPTGGCVKGSAGAFPHILAAPRHHADDDPEALTNAEVEGRVRTTAAALADLIPGGALGAPLRAAD